MTTTDVDPTSSGSGNEARAVPVAIVGLGVTLPGAPDVRSFWNNLVEGTDAVTDVPPRRWDARFYEPKPTGPRRADQISCRRGGFVDEEIAVDLARFGIDPERARTIDPEQLIALHVAAAAIEDAGGAARLGSPGRIGIVLGHGSTVSPGLARLDQRVRTARQLVHVLATLMPSLVHDDLERVRTAFTDELGTPPGPETLVPGTLASRLAGWLGTRGPAYAVDAACASSLIAVDAAVAHLTAGQCDAVVAGGVHHCHDITLWSVFSQLGTLSESQRISPLGAGADGMLLGEGTGMIVLKRLDDALAAGDRVYAVIRGSGVSSGVSGGPDGDGDGGTAGSPGRVEALERAWAVAGLDPRQAGSVGLVEAHGSGVREDDAAELEALAQVFGPACDDDIAVIGSVKSMIGHAMSAAGIAGLVKAALAVHRGVLLPTLNCETPNPAMEATRFRPLATACPWVSSEPRRAVVNAFGIGGANAHVILEQAPVGASPASAASTAPLTLPPARPPRRTPPTVSEPEQVLRFAAPTPEALIDLLDDDDAILRERGAGVPQYQGPGSRLGLVGPSERRLAVARRVARGARGGGWASWRGRNDVWLSSEPLLTFGQGRVAYVFPGLEAELAPHLDDVAEHFGLPWSPLPADGIGRHGSAVLRIGRVLEKALHRIGVVPSALAGHSIGEWNALYASGAVDADNVEDVVFGSVMDDIAALDVDYASLACPLEQAMEAIGNRPGIVVSHDNAPQQTIVCGPPAEIADLVREQRHRNVLAQVLPFRSGFHTPRLAPYLEEIARRVDAVPIRRGPGVELWSATLAGRYPDDPEQIRALTLRHLLEPVRFRPTILAMYSAGVRVFLQVGQGRLGGLIDDTLGFLPHLTIAANSSRRSGLDQLRRVAVALWVEGGAPDFDALKARSGFAAVGVSPHEDSLPQRDPVRMDLGTRLVTLDPAVLPRTDPVSAPVSALAPADGGDRGPARPTATGLEGWAQRDPLARELLDLLDDTARTAVTALEQVAGTRAVPSAGDRPDPASEYGGESVGEYDREPDPIETTTTSVPVSLESMPYLLDHCLAPQRRGWPEPADRRPVVPATTIVELMADLAAKAAPGKVVVGLTEVRFDRWLLAAPSTDVAVGVQPVGPDTVSVSFGEYARAVVRLADSYPDAGHSPWPHEGSQEYPPVISGPDLYTKRWLFHGPRFQGVATIIGHGDTHVRAVLTAGTAPGALLDAAGQLLAYFARVMLPDRYVLFPSAIDQIDFYGPAPAPGTPVTCLVWVPWTERDWLRAHLQLTVDGRVWAEVNGWVDRRFDVRPDMDEAFRFPERHAVGRRMPGGWTMVAEPWSDLATRDLFAGRYLGAAERQEFADLPPRDRRRWLLVRIAVKDAVRARLWDAGHEEVFPAETRVVPDGDGGFVVIGEHGLDLPPIRVRAAFHGDVAVASALPPGGDGAGTGIDIEEVRDRPQQAIDAALAAGEQELAADLARRTGLSALTWHTRFLAAKGAAGAATGVTGRPHGFTVTVTGDATRDRTGDGTGLLAVTTPSGPVVPVRVQEVSGPEHHPGRTYVVAWSEQAPAGARRDARIDAHPGGMS